MISVCILLKNSKEVFRFPIAGSEAGIEPGFLWY